MAVSNNTETEKRLWEAADELRANSKFRASEYSGPVLGLIFLRYADAKFAKAEAELAEKDSNTSKSCVRSAGIMVFGIS